MTEAVVDRIHSHDRRSGAGVVEEFLGHAIGAAFLDESEGESVIPEEKGRGEYAAPDLILGEIFRPRMAWRLSLRSLAAREVCREAIRERT